MKLHRYGLDCSEQLSLLTGYSSRPTFGYVYQWESAPRIVNGHFLLRHQVWLYFPLGYEVKVPHMIYTDVCPHLEFREYFWTSLRLRSSNIKNKMDCRASYWDNEKLNSKCLTCSGLFQCKICPTEFQIDVKEFLGKGVALVLTRWLDLGEGRTLSDPRYASHVLHRFCYS
jgi:hypothetical protein